MITAFPFSCPVIRSSSWPQHPERGRFAWWERHRHCTATWAFSSSRHLAQVCAMSMDLFFPFLWGWHLYISLWKSPSLLKVILVRMPVTWYQLPRHSGRQLIRANNPTRSSDWYKATEQGPSECLWGSIWAISWKDRESLWLLGATPPHPPHGGQTF